MSGMKIKPATGVKPSVSDSPATQWEDAARTAGRIVHPGPDVSKAKAIETVAVLREKALAAAPLAVRLSQMAAADGRNLATESLSRIYVVDRPNWALGAARSIHNMLDIGPNTAVPGLPDATDVSSNVEIAAALTFLSRKTLGQFDPFGSSMGPAVDDPAWPLSSADPRGNLLLVAPNILATQRSMAVDFPDFSLWVALHEQTHALQFAAAPWLKGHLTDLVSALINSFPSEGRLIEWARTSASILRGGNSFVDALLSPDQRVIFEQITTVMSVLEGHADVIMDLVSTRDIADVVILRRKFNARRTSSTRRSQLIMRLSGMDAKMDQYRTGAKFVSAVRKRVGLEGFNKVWEQAENLPTGIEINNPRDWIERVAC